jgi:dTDP-4-dehydrorhamnose reductase
LDVSISWANFARFFLDLQAIKTSIRLISSVEFATSQQQNNNKIIAQRPKNSVLKNTKISQNLPDWQTAVEKFLEN